MAAELTPGGNAAALSRRRIHFGSVYGKTVHDAHLPIAAMAGLAGGLLMLFGMFFADAYPTAEARRRLRDLVAGMPPVLKGLTYGSAGPVRFDTLGGYISQDPGVFFKLIPALWSILALSATLATEAHNGSLDFVAVTRLSRRRIAVEKLAGHVTAMAVIAAIVAAAGWFTGQAFARLPADAIPPTAAAGYAIWLGLTGLVAGSIAFALAPWLGRAAAAGIAGAVLFGSYILNSYQASFPAFAMFAKLTWFTWTSHHNPLAGAYDWPSLGILALVTVALFAAGVEAFTRRDLSASPGIGTMPGAARLSAPVLGLRGPVGRCLGDLLPSALAWGTGIGVYGLIIAASSRSFAHQLAKTPAIAAKLHSLFPNYDITSTGGVLQAAFMMFAYILTALAAASFIRHWASDETTGRLETLLASPLTRARWAIGGGLGVYLALTVVTVMIAASIAIGTAAAGGNVATAVTGTLAIGCYALGLAGTGLAVGGLAGPAPAAPIVAGLAIATFLLDVLAPPLKLAEPIRHLALTANMGQPMAGTWDWAGIAASLALALGGLVLASRGIRHRDIRR